MQKVENSNKVNAARGDTLESSAQNGSTEMVPFDAAPVDAPAHDEKIEDAILHNPEDVNEEAENAKRRTCILRIFGFLVFVMIIGGIVLLVVGILTSTDEYVCGCGQC